MSDKDEKLLSESEVYNVFDFAKNIMTAYNQGRVYTPDYVNARMKDINMNPLLANEHDVRDALNNPKSNESKIIGYNEYFELTNMIYKRSLGYISQMLSFDYTLTCLNAKGDEYKSKAYKKDLETIYDFLDKFDVKREFKKVTAQLYRQESFYSVFRTEGEKFVFQELPRDYCKITQRSEYGLLFDFNMMWFINNVGVDIDSYPKVFKKLYNRVFDSKTGSYKPSSVTRNGEWVYWTQTSQEDNFWAFKQNPDSITQVPYLSPLFNDLVLTPYIRELQKNKYVLEASAMMVGMIPMIQENKSGKVKDMLAVSPETAGQFLGVLRQGLSDVIGVGATPFEMKPIKFDGGKMDLQEQYNKNVSAQSGINSRLIYSTDKQTAVETEASLNVDTYIANYVYHQFNQFMDFQLNKLTKKYKFKFIFEGTEFAIERDKKFDKYIKLAEMGIVLPQKIAASIGMQPHDFMRQLEEAKVNEFTLELTPIMMAHQMSGTSSEGGRPRKSSGELSDSGMNTRESGANISKGGSV